ncbi:MAG: 3-methyl-2-oxobutanoate hydroxymethyltransferase [Bdellovibrionales bacterium]|jgi:3-methyl-2-oxobutanoate hydroxymethyltransferase|nr:3-methyl-2-oxobutanoate hydroxymethyltransferase [Bdellovibrionales bacterium]
MMNIFDFTKKKQAGDKITMVTCYDYTSAVLVNGSDVDCILVGDSLAMTMHGFPSTVAATVDMMAMHTAAVARGAKDKFIVADLPFLAYRGDLAQNIAAVQAVMQAGAHAVKIEGAAGNTDFVRHLTESGVPVMGHIGLTPQFVHLLGGYRVQGKTEESANRLKEEAIALEQAGAFSLVMECVPTVLAQEITASLRIATIGIGAGAGTDGQVLVFQDLLGLNTDFRPKFVKNFMDGAGLVTAALNEYNNAVKTGAFPDAKHSFNADGANAGRVAQPA